MIVNLEPTTVNWDCDYKFSFKQPIVLENTPVYKAASKDEFIGLVSGTYYVKNPNPLRGYIKIAANENDCEIRMDTLWYVKAEDIIKIIKRREKYGD